MKATVFTGWLLCNFNIDANVFEEALLRTASFWEAEGKWLNYDVCPLWSSTELLKRKGNRKQDHGVDIEKEMY